MSTTPGSPPPKEGGFLGFLMNLFSGLGGFDPERDKKRQLKDIRKELRKRTRFYRVKGEMAQVGMARFFYEIYKSVASAQIILDKYSESDIVKNVLVESAFSDKLKENVRELSPERIKERVLTTPMKKLTEEVKEELVQIYSALDASTAKNINRLYNDLLRFKAVIDFDYYFLIKKFDSLFPERDFVYNPRFEAISGSYIQNDLKDFLDVYDALDGKSEWDKLFSTLKNYREIDLIAPAAWRKILHGQREMAKTQTLHLIVRHLEQNPSWSPEPEIPQKEIVEAYVNKLKTAAELTIQEILRGLRRQKIELLLMKVFGTTAVSRTQYYTERENLTFHKKMLAGYIYVDPINYLKAFFLDYYKSTVRVMVDLLLIQGKWATTVSSQQFSEAYHQLMSQSDQLLDFDTSLSEEGPTGTRIKRLLRSSVRDKSSLTALRGTLGDVNNTAKRIINASAQNLITLGKSVKQLLEEFKSGGNEIVINWKELDTESEYDLGERMKEIYTQFYYMVQLLQYFMKDAK